MTLQRTPLNELHRKLGAKMVDFGGWEMPLYYTSIMEEHRAVRQRVGVFDVSHMGEIEVRGKEALSFVQYLVPNDVAKLELDQALYTPMCDPQGFVLDDLLIYRLPDLERQGEKYLLVVNVGTTEKDFGWIESQARNLAEVEIQNLSSKYAQVAIQGPVSQDALQRHVEVDLSRILYFHSMETELYKEAILISRTGYTGEDGFEVYGPPMTIVQLWKDLIKSNVTPIGLGARDSLRFEPGYPLYGHELDEQTTPIEAGLSWTVKAKPGNYNGKETLLHQKKLGGEKSLIGLRMTDPGVARQGYPVYADGAEAGIVTSGMKSITLDQFLGLGFIKKGFPKEVGQSIEIDIRGQRKAAEIIKLPFYRGSVKSP
jgi:aminomethyltransferase